VRDIFERALGMTPCLVFFDEFESIAMTRNAGSSSATDRIINQLLCYLDGTGSLEGVFVLAASSRPELIDPALLRSGRIDQHLQLPPPDLDSRLELINGYLHSLRLEDLTPLRMAQDTEHYSYSELASLVKEAVITLASTNRPQVLDPDLWSQLAQPKHKQDPAPSTKPGSKMILM
jgi:peroxin-1